MAAENLAGGIEAIRSAGPFIDEGVDEVVAVLFGLGVKLLHSCYWQYDLLNLDHGLIVRTRSELKRGNEGRGDGQVWMCLRCVRWRGERREWIPPGSYEVREIVSGEVDSAVGLLERMLGARKMTEEVFGCGFEGGWVFKVKDMTAVEGFEARVWPS